MFVSRPRDYDALLAFIQDAETRRYPFCARFPIGAVKAQGLPLPPGLPQWRSRAQAQAIVEAAGGLAALVDGLLPRLASPGLAQRGDIVAVPMPDGPCLAVVEGEYLVAAGAEGLERLPRSAATDAWSAQWR